MMSSDHWSILKPKAWGWLNFLNSHMANFQNSQGRKVVLAQVQTILDNRAYLSEVDGKIGDGDHGINMAKGFNLIKERLGDKEVSLSEGLGLIGKTLMTEIGASMGPIYGT